MFAMFKGDAAPINNLCVFAAVPLLSTQSQVEVVKRPPSWVVFVDVFPQLFGEDHPQLDLQVASNLINPPFTSHDKTIWKGSYNNPRSLGDKKNFPCGY